MKIKCRCGANLTGLKPNWVLNEKHIAGHQVATIGTAKDAASHIQTAAQAQISANLAAYELDYDYKFQLSDRRRSAWAQHQGYAFVQCPKVRKVITVVCFPK